jgi:hypothetical protein
MSLTIDRTIDRTDVTSTSGVEQWLEVMYGIRANATVRATFVPVNHDYPAGIANWLRVMWGLG